VTKESHEDLIAWPVAGNPFLKLGNRVNHVIVDGNDDIPRV
jgi:hypothetical protein